MFTIAVVLTVVFGLIWLLFVWAASTAVEFQPLSVDQHRSMVISLLTAFIVAIILLVWMLYFMAT